MINRFEFYFLTCKFYFYIREPYFSAYQTYLKVLLYINQRYYYVFQLTFRRRLFNSNSLRGIRHYNKYIMI